MSFDLGDLFKEGSIAQQILVWQVLGQVIQPLLNPLVETIARETWSIDPNMPLPADLCAGLVNRGLMARDRGESEAARSGVGPEQFAAMVDGAGGGPTLEETLELLRRGEIQLGEPGQSGVTFYGAMKDAGVRDHWAEFLAQLRVKKPSGEEALNALLQGQISRELAYQLWLEDGGDPGWFQHAFDAQGTSPTPDMLGTMANRGIIPWEGTGPDAVSFEQGFLEGPWRNKFLEAMRELMEYLPPARTVTALLHQGAIDDQMALALWEKEGLSPELAAAYLKSAHHTSAASHKELARSDIEQLYLDKLISEADAEKYLTELGYPGTVAQLMLKVADTRRAQSSLNAAVSRLRTLYTGRKITKTATLDALHELGVPASETSELLAVWDIQAAANIRQLTPAQIESGFHKEIITQQEAQAELEAIGYTPWDAWFLLSVKYGDKLPGEPAHGAGGIGVLP